MPLPGPYMNLTTGRVEPAGHFADVVSLLTPPFPTGAGVEPSPPLPIGATLRGEAPCVDAFCAPAGETQREDVNFCKLMLTR